MAASFSNITTVTSQPSTSAAGEANSFAPASTRAFAFAGFRFQTPTSCPTDINRCAIDDPIRPVPHTPIFIVDLNARVDGYGLVSVKDAEILRHQLFIVQDLASAAGEYGTPGIEDH